MNDIKMNELLKISDELLSTYVSKDLLNVLDKCCTSEEFKDDLYAQSLLSKLKQFIRQLSYTNKDFIQQRMLSLTEEEQIEFAEVNHIIDNNLFNYYFQPIVSTVDGSIYSFEALMRPISELCKSPIHILKYAELSGRLPDVEKATFLNILRLINDNAFNLGNRHIFINSISKVRLNEVDFTSILPLLSKYSCNVVIEMTEQTEIEDTELDDRKKLYGDIGVRLAIDDYGTGYSNVHNLIRYTPDYVKIDRTLISGVDTDHNKQHFVKEIITFCHDNRIMALAEGVETVDELQTVIKLGVDLVQGFYIARPSAVIISSIPCEIKDEIVKCQHNNNTDALEGIYRAKCVDKIYLNDVSNGVDYDAIYIEGNAASDKSSSIIISGNPVNAVRVVIEDNFAGDIILDGAMLTGKANEPAIYIGENCKVHLELIGGNKLLYGGIRVPESSELHITGNGVMNIQVDGSSFYAIGNDKDSKHGKLVFDQGVFINNYAALGICIGSGHGGEIQINGGKFELAMSGIMGVAIGAFKGGVQLDIAGCDLCIDTNQQKGVGIGTLDGNVKISANHSLIRTNISGEEVIGLGTLNGSKCTVDISEASLVTNATADKCSAIAAVNGHADIFANRANINLSSKGVTSFAVGYTESSACVHIMDSDIKARLSTGTQADTAFSSDMIDLQSGSIDVTINNTSVYSNNI